MLLDELPMALGRIGTHTEHNGIQFFKGLETIGEIARFGSAAGGVVLGIEIQYHPLALVIGKLDRVVLLVGKGKARGGLSNCYDCAHLKILSWFGLLCRHAVRLDGLVLL